MFAHTLVMAIAGAFTVLWGLGAIAVVDARFGWATVWASSPAYVLEIVMVIIGPILLCWLVAAQYHLWVSLRATQRTVRTALHQQAAGQHELVQAIAVLVQQSHADQDDGAAAADAVRAENALAEQHALAHSSSQLETVVLALTQLRDHADRQTMGTVYEQSIRDLNALAGVLAERLCLVSHEEVQDLWARVASGDTWAFCHAFFEAGEPTAEDIHLLSQKVLEDPQVASPTLDTFLRRYAALFHQVGRVDVSGLLAGQIKDGPLARLSSLLLRVKEATLPEKPATYTDQHVSYDAPADEADFAVATADTGDDMAENYADLSQYSADSQYGTDATMPPAGNNDDAAEDTPHGQDLQSLLADLQGLAKAPATTQYPPAREIPEDTQPEDTFTNDALADDALADDEDDARKHALSSDALRHIALDIIQKAPDIQNTYADPADDDGTQALTGTVAEQLENMNYFEPSETPLPAGSLPEKETAAAQIQTLQSFLHAAQAGKARGTEGTPPSPKLDPLALAQQAMKNGALSSDTLRPLIAEALQDQLSKIQFGGSDDPRPAKRTSDVTPFSPLTGDFPVNARVDDVGAPPQSAGREKTPARGRDGTPKD
jgi:hypothetical protein